MSHPSGREQVGRARGDYAAEIGGVAGWNAVNFRLVEMEVGRPAAFVPA